MTEFERARGFMHSLPLYSEGKENHGLALRRQRDAVLEKASKCPQRLADGVEALVRECVFETLRLTGAPVTRQAVADVWAGTAEPAEPAEPVERELIRGQRDALHAIRQAAGSRPELTPGLVREVHRLSSPPSGGGFRTGSIAAQFTAAAPSRPDLISDKVANLCDWLTADSGRTMHPPEKAGLAFARLLEISPFEHGNFRTAHLLLSFFAFAEGYPPFFLRLEEADQVREEVERAMVFETLPLVNRLARALASSLSFCLEALSSGSSEERPGP